MVTVTISETIAGSEVGDTLAGGSTGVDFGQVVTGSYAPVTDQSANTGAQALYVRHDATVDPITDCAWYLVQYSGTYGGASSASADKTALLALGAADSGADKNNNDGNSRGLHMDMDWQVTASNMFAYSREASGNKRIFGKDYSGLDGSDLANAFPLHVDACSYYNGSTEADATTPVTGKIGKSNDTVLGNRGHVFFRYYLHSSATTGGINQVTNVFTYSFTA